MKEVEAMARLIMDQTVGSCSVPALHYLVVRDICRLSTP